MKKLYILFLASAMVFTSAAQVNFTEGEVVPDFTITEPNGTSHTLYDYTSQGKWVLIDFFAYWCGPCANTAPTIVDFYHKYGCNAGNIIVLGVEVDGTNAQLAGFDDWAGITEDNPYPSGSGLEGGGDAVQSAYQPSAFPTIIAVSPENILLNHDIWPISGVQTLESNFPAEALVEMSCSVNVIESARDMDFAVYPNPTNGVFTVAFGLTAGSDIRFVVCDACGREVMNTDLGKLAPGFYTHELNASSLGPGIYHVELFNAEGIVLTKKLSIQ